MQLQTNDGRLYVIAGASRSGKTAWTVRAIKGARRVIVWDVEAQWCELPGFRKISTRAELFAAIQKPGPGKLAYVAGGDIGPEFDFWAGCVKYWGQYCGPCVAVAEELADVTSQGKAPGNWGILLRRGMKRGISIYAISQRWAEADKTAMGNASEFVIFRMSSGDDVAYMARKTRIQVGELEGLKPLEFVRMDAATGERNRDKLRFR
ncbi:MAG: hypothetical protein U0932_01040 [Thiobacillus sp.]|nr:hypothetical protein [Thiobacillus sp.]